MNCLIITCDQLKPKDINMKNNIESKHNRINLTF